jgi:hypothetical protein
LLDAELAEFDALFAAEVAEFVLVFESVTAVGVVGVDGTQMNAIPSTTS